MNSTLSRVRLLACTSVAAFSLTASAWAQTPKQTSAAGTPLPDWKINEICKRDSAAGQCAAFEAGALKAISGSWPFVFDDVRKACVASIKPADQSWRVLSDCVDETMEKQRDAQAVKTRATPAEAVPPPRLEAETRQRAEAEARAKAEAEALAKTQAEQRARAEAEAIAKARADAEQRAKVDADAKLRADAEALAQAAADLAARAKLEADAKARIDADLQAKTSADDRAKANAEARLKAETDAKMRAEADAKAKAEAEAKAASEARLKAETDAKMRAEADAKAKAEAEAKAASEARAKACQEPVTVAAKSGAIRFRVASTTLLPESLKVLDAVAAAFKQCANVAITVEGHTDTTGDDAINTPLSNDRAEAVKAYLIKAGVPVDKIDAKGLGSTKPTASNDTPEGRAQNRRIDFVVSAK